MPVSRAVRRRIKIKLEKAILEGVKNNGERIFVQSQHKNIIPCKTGQMRSTGQFERKSWGWMLQYGGNSGGTNGKGAPYAPLVHEGRKGGRVLVQGYSRKAAKPKLKDPTGAKKRGRSKYVNRGMEDIAGYYQNQKSRVGKPWVRTSAQTKMTYLLDDLFAALQKQFRARGGSVQIGVAPKPALIQM